MYQMGHVVQRFRPGKNMIFFCAIILVSACAPESDRSLTGPQAVARGEQLFDHNCGYCHGTDGRGPPLSGIKSLSRAERHNKIFNHPVAGQIPQRLKAHELSDLSDFFDSEKNSVVTGSQSVTGLQAVARGEQVFDYNCGYCHGTDGRGPPLSGILSLSKVERRNKIINHPVSGRIPQRFKAHELSDLGEFFDSE